jgi:hypothetical protein
MSIPTIVASVPDVDGVASAVVACRAASGPFQTFFFESARLVDFLRRPVQSKLPGFYTLIICGLDVVHTNWDGELLRPRLMDALRGFVSPVLWFSARPWSAEDRAAVANVLGEEKLAIWPDAPCTADLVCRRLASADDAYAARMVRFAAGNAPEASLFPCADDWRSVISSLRGEPERLTDAVQPLLDGTPEKLDKGLKERAARIEQENRDIARNAETPVDVYDKKLTTIAIPPGHHAFWREIGALARAQAGAEFCLCHLLGRPVLVLTRNPEERMDLRRWARYLTDLMPEALAVGEQPDAVPLFVRGLDSDLGLRHEAIGILRDGAHLLAG